MTSDTVVQFSREMGFTRSEFFRILPAALASRPYTETAQRINVELDKGSWTIDISEQKYRQIASIRLPYLEVAFCFQGLEQQSVDEIMRYFDLRYQRGGG